MRTTIYPDIIHIHPIFIITICFITGIIWQTITNTHVEIIALSIATIIVAITYAKKKNIVAKYILITTIPFFAATTITDIREKQQQTFYARINNKPIDVIALVREIERTTQKRFPISVTLQAKKIKNTHPSHATWEQTNKTIQLYTQQYPNIQVGDTIEVKNIIGKTPKKNDFNRYLIKQNIAASLFMENITYEILHRPKISLSRWLSNTRKQVAQNIKKKMPPKHASLFLSIFLGSKKTNKKQIEQLKEDFRPWGILHFLARSGLHLIAFLLLCEFLLQCIPIYIRKKRIITVIIGTLYLLLSWPSVSFIRAFSIFILYKCATITYNRTSFTYLLSLTCLAMLIYNPFQLFFLDFQLSFSLTFALSLLGHMQQNKITKGISPQ